MTLTRKTYLAPAVAIAVAVLLAFASPQPASATVWCCLCTDLPGFCIPDCSDGGC